MRRPGQAGLPRVRDSSPSQNSRFPHPGGMATQRCLSAGTADFSPASSGNAEFSKFPGRSSKARPSLSAAGGGPPLYVLASGALYGSETFQPKYVLTQIIVLQSAFYFLYALLALGALTFFVGDRGDMLAVLPFAGHEATSDGDAAFSDPAGRAGGLVPARRFVIRESSPNGNEDTAAVGFETDSRRFAEPHGRQSAARDGADLNEGASGRYWGTGRGMRRAKILFETELYRFATREGRVLLLVLFLSSLAMAYLVFLVVQRTRKCLDFCFSIHFFHLLACWIFGGFPSNSAGLYRMGNSEAALPKRQQETGMNGSSVRVSARHFCKLVAVQRGIRSGYNSTLPVFLPESRNARYSIGKTTYQSPPLFV
ncbi:conserved hypothetical protein [Neospora caninum Liverpool]|uniref:Transmembrane protein n=1 Tax=Neospora caninum (strain Liverpool) TaxID=572307 RepID=F0VM11_NEOCL|nr:conserved hypothetical protein [Neospora caninum Liverpool]CBZ54289.1 conserved hypothetical protein [Neospora caninum Liverpool]|eukprot:XP_003884320.1 conserved hypothetical protein [Neospora caninum Liverpool]